MTNYFVNGLQEQTGTGINGQNMTGTDNIFVSSTGDIVALGGGAVSAIFLDANSTSNSVTIQGQVYCAGGDAIYSESGDLNLVLNGSAFAGVDGINLLGLGNILIGAQGELSVNGNGIVVGANASDSTITVDGSIFSANGAGLNVSAQTNISVNEGAVVSAKYNGVLFYSGSAGSSLYNAGTIESNHNSNNDIYVADANIQIDNAGLISGPVDPMDINGANTLIINSGTITGQGGDSFILFGGASNTVIDNSGMIIGVIQTNGAAGPLTVSNSGTITATSFAVQGTAYNDSVTNSGTIHGAIDLGTGTDTVNNDGKIVGYVAFEGAGDSLDNSGTIKGNLYMGTGDSVTNTGVIRGNVTFAGGTNTLDTSHGEITGTVTGGSGSDTFIAAGSQPVTFIGGSGTEVMTGGAGDDTITAGSGKDTITGGRGDDHLTAGTGRDTFNYNGNFGNDTIDKFHTNFDIIHFAANDFASYTALESHMAQAGADVVITLDANDSIVLTHETLANFTSSDFTFG
jgi:hypothetical protein